MLPIPFVQALQVLTVAGAAPLVSGVISRIEARLQGRRGPRVLQPYYDLAKLFRKEALAPEQASWFSWPRSGFSWRSSPPPNACSPAAWTPTCSTCSSP